MAGDWLPVRVWITKTHEIAVIAERCEMATETVAGHLLNLWSFASENTENGVLEKMTFVSLVCAIGAHESFWRAAEFAGWLVCDDRGIVIPNWDNWMSCSAKKRLKDRLRKKLQRRKNVRKMSAKCPQNVREVSHSEWDKNGTIVGLQYTEYRESINELLRSSPRMDAASHRSGESDSPATPPPPTPPKPATPKAEPRRIWGKPPIQFDSQNAVWLGISEHDLKVWSEACPGVVIEVELARAAAWVSANPKQGRKSSYKRFLTSWLMRAQDHSRVNRFSRVEDPSRPEGRTSASDRVSGAKLPLPDKGTRGLIDSVREMRAKQAKERAENSAETEPPAQPDMEINGDEIPF